MVMFTDIFYFAYVWLYLQFGKKWLRTVYANSIQHRIIQRFLIVLRVSKLLWQQHADIHNKNLVWHSTIPLYVSVCQSGWKGVIPTCRQPIPAHRKVYLSFGMQFRLMISAIKELSVFETKLIIRHIGSFTFQLFRLPPAWNFKFIEKSNVFVIL